jgi:hypothetical protein
MKQYESYPKKECHKHVGCHLVPCLPNLWTLYTPLVLLYCEQLLHTVKWLTSHYLDSVEDMHHVGFDMGVLGSPTKELRKIRQSQKN